MPRGQPGWRYHLERDVIAYNQADLETDALDIQAVLAQSTGP